MEVRDAEAAAAEAALAEAANHTKAREQSLETQIADCKRQMGLDPRYNKVPDATFHGDASRGSSISNRSKSVVKHVHAAVDGRLETAAGAEAVAKALKKEGPEAMRRLMDTPQMVAEHKAVVQNALNRQDEHWNALMAVHV